MYTRGGFMSMYGKTNTVLLSKNKIKNNDKKESTCNVGDLGLIPGVRKIPRRRAWHPTPVFLPGQCHGQRSLAGYSPRGHGFKQN